MSSLKSHPLRVILQHGNAYQESLNQQNVSSESGLNFFLSFFQKNENAPTITKITVYRWFKINSWVTHNSQRIRLQRRLHEIFCLFPNPRDSQHLLNRFFLFIIVNRANFNGVIGIFTKEIFHERLPKRQFPKQ